MIMGKKPKTLCKFSWRMSKTAMEENTRDAVSSFFITKVYNSVSSSLPHLVDSRDELT